MASISSSGVGSGFDVNSLVSKLVAADRAPLDARIARRETSLTVQVSGLGTLKGALSAFSAAVNPLKDTTAFSARTVTLDNQDILSATADTKAATGNYGVEVVALAQAHQLASGSFAAGNTAVVGTGTLQITQGTASFNVLITSSNNTLAGIRDTINAASGNTGVQATLIHDTVGTRLVLSAKNTGAASAIKVSQSGGNGGLSQLVYDPAGIKNLTELRAAQDALIRVAGFNHTSATNTITGAIDGVTLNLKTQKAGTIVSVAITNDQTTIVNRVQTFVDQYNKLQSTFATLRSFDSTTGKTGQLFGDALLRQVEDQTRTDLSNPVAGLTGSYTSLASIGVTKQVDGTLKLDSTKLTNALSTGNGGVAAIFGSTNGVAARLASHIDAQLASGATFDFRNQSLQKSLKDVATQKANVNTRMTEAKARYQKQYSALDSLLANLQSQSNFLSQQLANLPQLTINGK
jgi:flagellar hook-associated protein 2